MHHNFDEIKNTYFTIHKNITLLDMMLQFEGILEESGLYGYANWFDGEILSGPRLKKYWFEVTLMYPYEGMPDPDGALRLKKLGCKVFFEKGKFKEPVRVLSPEDTTDIRTRQAKMEINDVWLVTIKMPRRLIDIAVKKFVDLDKAGIESNDAEDFDSSVELDDDAASANAGTPDEI